MKLRDLCFLTLLRDAMAGTCSTEAATLAKSMDWTLENQVLELAQLHHVFPLLAQQLLLLNPPDLRRDVLRHWAMEALARQAMATQALLVLTGALEKAGIPALVVKGAVCRSLYPSPDLRPSSDEDILIQPEDLPVAEQVFRSLGYCLQSSPEDSVQIWYANPLRVELHCSLCGSMTIAGQAVQPWFDACFSRSISWNVGEGTVRTLAQQDHFLYLILHFYKHFLTGGVGIRQLCDICLFAGKQQANLDWSSLWTELETLSLACLTWNMLDLGIRYLGLDSRAVPKPGRIPAADSEDLLQDILEAGVFGSSSLERKHSSRITLQAASAQNRKAGTVRAALFPSASDLQSRYSYLQKNPWLLPAAWCARCFGYLREGRNLGVRAASAAKIGRQRVALLEKYGILNCKI